jgi:F-type H+-transporting ATPase subunit gamma
MKTYLAYKSKIQGFEDVSETVKAVEKIAAFPVHVLKTDVTNLRTHTKYIEQSLADMIRVNAVLDHPLLREKKTGKKVLVCITGDKGLVGGLWHDVVNSLLERDVTYNVVASVGARGTRYLKEEYGEEVRVLDGLSDIPTQSEIDTLTKYIFDGFMDGDFKTIDILYPSFVSVAEQKPEYISFLPFSFSSDDFDTKKAVVEGFPILEPSGAKVFGVLLEKYIRAFLHKVVLEAKLSEFSSRTVAMEHANTKTDDVLVKLQHAFKSERRRMVTARQLEIFTTHNT